MSNITGTQGTHQDTLYDALMALKQNILLDTHVAEVCRVVESKGNNTYVVVPINDDSKKLFCHTIATAEIHLNDVVLVIFTDTNSSMNLNKVSINKTTQNTSSDNLHSISNGIILTATGGGSSGGTTVTVNGLAQTTWEANTKADQTLVTSISNELSALGLRVQTVEASITNVVTIANQANTTAQQANTTANAAQTKNTEQDGRLDSLESDVASNTANITTMSGEIDALDTSVEAAQTTANTAITQIDEISQLIPSQASNTNQLADKEFVNSTVSTNTANFRGNWSTYTDIPTNVDNYPEDYSGNKKPTVNDYLTVQQAADYHSEDIFTAVGMTADRSINDSGEIVVSPGFGYTDKLMVEHDSDRSIRFRATASGPSFNFRVHAYDVNNNWLGQVLVVTSGYTEFTVDAFADLPEGVSYLRVSLELQATNVSLYTYLTLGSWRFKYTGNWDTLGKDGWEPEYLINDTPFTAAQMATINSGVTKETIDSVKADIASNTSSINSINDVIGDIDDELAALNSAVANKQGKLTQPQLDATNSGITSAKVNDYDAVKQQYLKNATINAANELTITKQDNTTVVYHASSAGGGTTVTVGGQPQSVWNADSKADKTVVDNQGLLLISHSSSISNLQNNQITFEEEEETTEVDPVEALKREIYSTVYNTLYPIGREFICEDNTDYSNYLGFRWEKIDEGYALWTASSGAGTTINAGLPNIKGSATTAIGAWNNTGSFSGALSRGAQNGEIGSSGTAIKKYALVFDAHSYNNIYDDSVTTVQPPARKVYVWKRIA